MDVVPESEENSCHIDPEVARKMAQEYAERINNAMNKMKSFFKGDEVRIQLDTGILLCRRPSTDNYYVIPEPKKEPRKRVEGMPELSNLILEQTHLDFLKATGVDTHYFLELIEQHDDRSSPEYIKGDKDDSLKNSIYVFDQDGNYAKLVTRNTNDPRLPLATLDPSLPTLNQVISHVNSGEFEAIDKALNVIELGLTGQPVNLV